MKEYEHEFANHWFNPPTSIEEASGLNIIRAGQNVAKKYYHLGPRFISYFSLHCVLKGRGTYTSGGDEYSLKEGDVFCLYAGKTHSYYTSQHEKLEMFWIAFEGSQALPLLNRLSIYEESLYLKGILTTKSRHTIESLVQLYKEYDERKEFKKVSLIYQLFDNFYEEISKKRKESDSKKDCVQNGIAFIDRYYNEGISIADVADYVGRDRSYFSNLFAKTIGVSPNRYLQERIMSKATELLLTTHYTITEIAFSLSYSDIYSFSKSFKNHYGLSPKTFRDINGKDYCRTSKRKIDSNKKL